MNRSPKLRSIIARSVEAATALEASACGEGAEPSEARFSMADTAEVPVLRLEYSDGSACGRRPMVDTEAAASSVSETAYFERAALLEAAAVQAFHEMAGHLLGFGAPNSLVMRCRQAAQEELGHALTISRMARRVSANEKLLPTLRNADQIWRDARMGALVHAPTLFDFAEHNAVEGCVRESLGAAVALWQSLHSTDPAVRHSLARIAEEEASHAQLSWDIDTWCQAQLTDEQNAQLTSAKVQAGKGVRRGLSANDNEAGGVAGLPGTVVSRGLLDRIAGSTWAAVESQ